MPAAVCLVAAVLLFLKVLCVICCMGFISPHLQKWKRRPGQATAAHSMLSTCGKPKRHLLI